MLYSAEFVNIQAKILDNSLPTTQRLRLREDRLIQIMLDYLIRRPYFGTTIWWTISANRSGRDMF